MKKVAHFDKIVLELYDEYNQLSQYIARVYFLVYFAKYTSTSKLRYVKQTIFLGY